MSRIFRYLLFAICVCPSAGAGFIPRRISVIMTTYNREALVMDAVRSILGQTYADFDFIIVDDASTDGTFDRLQREVSDPRVQVHRLSKNVGMYAASNYALKHWVEGEYVTWQDSDDTSHPDRLYRQVEHIENYPVDAVSIPHFRVHENRVNYDNIPVSQGPVPNLPILGRLLPLSLRGRGTMSMTRALFRTQRVFEIGGLNGHGLRFDFAVLTLVPHRIGAGRSTLFLLSPP